MFSMETYYLKQLVNYPLEYIFLKCIPWDLFPSIKLDGKCFICVIAYNYKLKIIIYCVEG